MTFSMLVSALCLEDLQATLKDHGIPLSTKTAVYKAVNHIATALWVVARYEPHAVQYLWHFAHIR